MSLGEIQPPFGTTKDSITLDDYLAKYNSSPVEELNFLAPRKTITGKFVPDKKENETMSLGTMEQREDMKKQAIDQLSTQIEKAYKCGCKDGKRQSQELIEQAYQRGYQTGREQGRNDGYEDWKNSAFNDVTIDAKSFIEQGRNEAWECIRKIEQMPISESEQIFNQFGLHNIMNHYSATEAVEKIREYEEQKKQEESEIKVGDVIIQDDAEAVVTWCNGKDWNGFLLKGEDVGEVGQTYSCISCKRWKKTGRHFPEIAEVLRKMQEGE